MMRSAGPRPGAFHSSLAGARSASDDALALPIEILRAVADSEDTTYLLSNQLALVRTNAAWSTFARANGGEALLQRWTRGSSILSAISLVLREFYRHHYTQALVTGQRWEHDYDCPTPAQQQRFRMFVHPVAESFLLVSNALVEAAPHDGAAWPADLSRYAVDEVITMCANCRRVRNPRGHLRWDWVPELVAHQPANLSHGLCEVCAPMYAVGA